MFTLTHTHEVQPHVLEEKTHTDTQRTTRRRFYLGHSSGTHRVHSSKAKTQNGTKPKRIILLSSSAAPLSRRHASRLCGISRNSEG